MKKLLYSVTNGLTLISGAALVITIALVCLSVILRRAHIPLLGTVEVCGLLLVILVSFAIAHTQVQRGHVDIDLVTSRLPQRVQAVINSINWLLSLIFFSLVTWQMVNYALDSWRTGSRTDILKIPPYYAIVGLALGLVLLCLVLLVDLIDSIAGVQKK